TITCSNFLRVVPVSSYDGDRYLLTASGKFIELYDLDKFHSKEYNAREYQPIRTHVFEKTNVQSCVLLNDAGHLLAITSDYSYAKRDLLISGCIIHRDTILEGGYAKTTSLHTLFEGTSRNHSFTLSVIPSTTE
ncbi:hypothetical protein PENTCL1PPCAC_23425, partial [Pristionchus entomophagus]